jgi:hypothetical protein
MFKKWYVQLALALLAGVILVFVLIVVDQLETGEELFKTNVPGRQGEPQSVRFSLEGSEQTHVLVLSPDIESGWGDPDVYLEAVLLDPSGNELVRVEGNDLFGGSDDDGGSRNYTKKFEFKAETSGEYTLEVRTLTEHVEAIYITIGRRSDG